MGDDGRSDDKSLHCLRPGEPKSDLQLIHITSYYLFQKIADLNNYLKRTLKCFIVGSFKKLCKMVYWAVAHHMHLNIGDLDFKFIQEHHFSTWKICFFTESSVQFLI